MRILIADDEAEIRQILGLLLTSEGYEVSYAKDGREAVKSLEEDREIDLCIMDIMMPRMSGIEAVGRIREFSSVPVLFLTARSLESDMDSAYSSGGDDYLVKPFSAAEVLMKVRALIRRYNSYKGKDTEPEGAVRLSSGVTVNTERRVVMKNGVELELRDKEADVLIYLTRNRGRAIGADELYRAVWGEMPLSTAGNNITVQILNLRRKLEDNPSAPKVIRTVWGRGYQID